MFRLLKNMLLLLGNLRNLKVIYLAFAPFVFSYGIFEKGYTYSTHINVLSETIDSLIKILFIN